MDIAAIIWYQLLIGLVLNLKLVVSDDGHHHDDNDDDEGPEWEGKDVFKMNSIIENIEHLKEHMGDVGFDWDHLDQNEAAFQYFSFHDLNKDHKLDGLEILAALRHGAHDNYDRIEKKNLNPAEMSKRINLLTGKLANTVDFILKEDDQNEDGYLDYYEYSKARKANVVLEQLNINRTTT